MTLSFSIGFPKDVCGGASLNTCPNFLDDLVLGFLLTNQAHIFEMCHIKRYLSLSDHLIWMQVFLRTD